DDRVFRAAVHVHDNWIAPVRIEVARSGYSRVEGFTVTDFEDFGRGHPGWLLRYGGQLSNECPICPVDGGLGHCLQRCGLQSVAGVVFRKSGNMLARHFGQSSRLAALPRDAKEMRLRRVRTRTISYLLGLLVHVYYRLYASSRSQD